jgi:hypothetical protein
MADEFLEELGLEDETPEPQVTKQDKRLKDLSEKVKLTSEERDEKDKLLQEATLKAEAAEKSVEFYKGLTGITSKPEFAGASEYEEQIKEKFDKGYTLEDATVSALREAGRLPGMTQAPIAQESPAGGSSNTAISTGERSVAEMTQDERRAELSKLSPEEMQSAFRSASSI